MQARRDQISPDRRTAGTSVATTSHKKKPRKISSPVDNPLEESIQFKSLTSGVQHHTFQNRH